MKAEYKLAVILSHPTQYYSPWFRWLANDRAITIKVFYCWDFGVTNKRDPSFQTNIQWDVDLLNGYESCFIPNYSPSPGTTSFWGLINPGAFYRIINWKPDAVLLFGYPYFTHLLMILAFRLLNIPLIFRGDSHFIGRGNIPLIKRLLLDLIFSNFASITYVGIANKQYYKRVLVPKTRMVFAPHSVNSAHFTSSPDNISASQVTRKELGIDNRRVLLFAGKLVPNKQPIELCMAFLEVASPDKHALVFVGDGPEKVRLLEMASKHPDFCIRFIPFSNQSAMPGVYLLADIFILPSKGYYETWGLAVNEAMHMGVPCIVSDRVGCQQNLVIDGVTGWVFSSENYSDLARCLRLALNVDLSPFRSHVFARISQYTYPHTSVGLYEAVHLVFQNTNFPSI